MEKKLKRKRKACCISKSVKLGILQLQILYLLKHDSIMIIYTSSFRKYKKRVINSSLHEKSLKNKILDILSQHFQLYLLPCHNFSSFASVLLNQIHPTLSKIVLCNNPVNEIKKCIRHNL